MTHDPQESLPQALAALLAVDKIRYTRQALIQLGPWPPAAVDEVLRLFAARGLARPSRSGLWRGRAEALRAFSRERAPETTARPLLRAVASLERGAVLDGCEILLEEVRHTLDDGRCAAVLALLDLLLSGLRRWSGDTEEAEALRRYLSVFRSVQGISIYMGKSGQEVLDLLPRARAAAEALGDRRVTLMLDLTEASQRHLTRMHNTERPYALLARTLASIRELGDPDILEEASHSIGILHFMQGAYSEALPYLETGAVSRFTAHFNYFEEARLRYIGSAACSLGLPAKAAGILLAGLREARLRRNRQTRKWIQTHLADDLMRMGRPDEGLALLDELLLCCDPATETTLWIWNMRSLAHYHFLKGRVATSHRIFYASMRYCVRMGLQRPYYGFTWLFDMLWAYEWQGLPRIPGYDLEDELAAAQQSPNRHLKGAALRIRALQARARGVDPAQVRGLLVRGLTYAKRVGSPLEIARCRLALAYCLSRRRARQAELLFSAARAVLRRYTQYDCPDGPGGEPDAPYCPDGRSCLRRCREGLEALPAWSDLDAHLADMLRIVSETFEVERAALFSPDAEGPVMVCNISRLELESPGFRPVLKKVAAVMEAASGEPARAARGAGIYLPLTVPNARPWLLFLQCEFFTGHISAQGTEIFRELGGLLARELQTARRLQEGMRKALHAVEERGRVAAERMAALDEPYYGAGLDDVLRQADSTAVTDAPVLILGETGVGKDLLARRVHARSGRAGAFVPIHPASIPEQLFESELFGHEKGAFTGAWRQKLGHLEVADGGTLFIDEVGDVPLPMQTKLLRVLQEKCFMRVGGIREIRSDFRLVAATNRDLKSMVAQGRFREDLYYRISVVPLTLPPLRERPADIPLLARRFVEMFSRRYQRRVPPLEREELERLRAYAWPGNVRELKNVVERAVILHSGGPLHLLRPVEAPPLSAEKTTPSGPLSGLEWEDLPNLEELQRRYIRHVLRLARGRVDGENGALRILGMKRSTLYARIRAWGLDAVSQLYGREK